MDNVLQGPAQSLLTVPPRFALGRAAGGSLLACLWLWTSAGALAAAPADAAAPSAYRNALDCFNRADDARALTLLERAPANGSPGEQADICNLPGRDLPAAASLRTGAGRVCPRRED